VEAVAHFCTLASRNQPTDIHFQSFGNVHKFSPAFELAVYRIVQEVVHNILKHAKATEALVQMSFSDQIFDLSIEDNGIGIPDNVRAKTGGMGLRSIADRVQAINGRISITNLSGKGTGIYLEVPLQTETATT
jgi:two-component system NarL family sensor kinase